MKRTDSYQFTVTDPKDPRIVELKKQIAFCNKLSREATRGYNYNDTVHALWRVRLMPRGKRVEAAWGDYRSRRAYDSYLPIRHGSHYDVYVHRDSTAEDMMQRELDTGLKPGQLKRLDAEQNALRLEETRMFQRLRDQGIHATYTPEGLKFESREKRIKDLRDRGISEATIERLT